MKYVTLLILVIVSFATSRLVLWLANPNDPEGTNLLVTTVVAIVVFVPLLFVYLRISKRHNANK
ncbi:exported protein of unknown function [Candidatus Saccharimonas aalborgensis]|uniref:Uncharacterized protein n=1 Tax=Candidatus Saccharimonas aalborgensis TaxID=1332188 RepID=R4PVD0_9BACT|nr:hypothetical protein [Candidatus Saccharimonas aalborgensis]AGL62175.1 exported protein of unknown function [Candidatus Saccharimonas aalborgensis]QQS68689.1 MAG: hypothetical protein IPP24_01495 [Candidatus Saccharibacteria bacterium]